MPSANGALAVGPRKVVKFRCVGIRLGLGEAPAGSSSAKTASPEEGFRRSPCEPDEKPLPSIRPRLYTDFPELLSNQFLAISLTARRWTMAEEP